MSKIPTKASPHRSVDATGRALPMTDDEIMARAEVAIRALDALDDMGSEEEQTATLNALIEALDRNRAQEDPPTSTAPKSEWPCAIDRATGRLLPQTEEERLARTEALRQSLDKMATMTGETDTDEIWRDVFRGIDEGRPHRPLFEGYY